MQKGRQRNEAWNRGSGEGRKSLFYLEEEMSEYTEQLGNYNDAVREATAEEIKETLYEATKFHFEKIKKRDVAALLNGNEVLYEAARNCFISLARKASFPKPYGELTLPCSGTV